MHCFIAAYPIDSTQRSQPGMAKSPSHPHRAIRGVVGGVDSVVEGEGSIAGAFLPGYDVTVGPHFSSPLLD